MVIERRRMAREFLERLAYEELARMAGQASSDDPMEEFFGKLVRKLSQPFMSPTHQPRHGHNRRNHLQQHNSGSVRYRRGTSEKIEMSDFGYGFDMDRTTPFHRGQGHSFQAQLVKCPTFCDYCRDLVFEVDKPILVCQYCQYTCHSNCRHSVQLDCEAQKSISSSKKPSSAETSLTGLPLDGSLSFSQDTDRVDAPSTSAAYRGPIKQVFPQQDSGYGTAEGNDDLTSACGETLRRKINVFNDISNGLRMDLLDDGKTFQGFVRVTMNLTRPINMAVGARPPSIYDILSHEVSDEDTMETTSFYLPKETFKILYISSETKTKELIKSLLAKFKITDNPMKFALYEHYQINEKDVKIRKLCENEHPLALYLSWVNDDFDKRKFVLQENELGEIMWDAFSLPELQNFLRILTREESEHAEQIRAKYKIKRLQLEFQKRELERLKKEEEGKETEKQRQLQLLRDNESEA